MFKIKLLTFFLLVYQSATADPTITDSSNVSDTLRYNLEVLPQKDRTDLKITLHFKVQSDTAVLVKLPQDMYGTPDLHRFVTSFLPIDGCEVSNSEKAGTKLVKPNKNGDIKIAYLLSYDPEVLKGISYAPAIAKNYFNLAFCQWILRIGKSDVVRSYNISFSAPSNWSLYNSVSHNSSKIHINDSYLNIGSAVFGGTNKPVKKYLINGKPLMVIVNGDFLMGNNKIERAAYEVAKTQRNWFNDYNYPFYYVLVTERADNIAGTRINNMFKCFVKKDVKQEKLCWLLSHEMFHEWVGGKIYVSVPAGEPIDKFQWFHEGVNDYLARLLMMEMKWMNRQQFAETINDDIKNIADNSYRNYNFKQMATLADSGKFGQEASKLSYYRGALMALKWDTELKINKSRYSIKDFIRHLYKSGLKNEKGLEENEFFNAAAKFGIPMKQDYARYILNGEPITLPGNALGNSFLFKETLYALFERGFTMITAQQKKIIDGVTETSPAFAAGLRNGMELVSSANSNRFGNAWERDKPYFVTVRENGVEKTFSYMPLGKPVTLKLFQKRE